MFTLARAKRSMGAQGEPIPTVFRSLAAYDFHFRRGQLVLVAAGPGVGKSVLSQNLAMKAGCPALYFSLDSDAFTMYKRGASIVTGHRSKDVENAYNNGNGGFYDAKLDAVENVRYDFTGAATVDDLEDAIDAFAVVYGEYPHLLVIDNLVNVDGHDLADAGKSQTGPVIAYLKTLAQNTNACVVILHHLTGQYDDGVTPAPLSALIEKVSKFPENVLNLFRAEVAHGTTTQMGACLVKNRDGTADPSGNLYVLLHYDPPYAKLEDKK